MIYPASRLAFSQLSHMAHMLLSLTVPRQQSTGRCMPRCASCDSQSVVLANHTARTVLSPMMKSYGKRCMIFDLLHRITMCFTSKNTRKVDHRGGCEHIYIYTRLHWRFAPCTLVLRVSHNWPFAPSSLTLNCGRLLLRCVWTRLSGRTLPCGGENAGGSERSKNCRKTFVLELRIWIPCLPLWILGL